MKSTMLIAILLLFGIVAGFGQSTVVMKDDTKKEAERIWELAISAIGGRERLYAVHNMVVTSRSKVRYGLFKTMRLVVCAFVFASVNSGIGSAQSLEADQNKTDPAKVHIEGVTIKAQNLRQMLSEVSLENRIPIGFETSLGDDNTPVKIDFSGGTLSDFLTQLLNQYDSYTWESKDGVVNIFPKDENRDSLFKELLETKISRFSIKKQTSCYALENSLAAIPQIKKVIESHGMTYHSQVKSGFFIEQVGEGFAPEFLDTTLKSILNKVIKDSPKAKYWSLGRYRDKRHAIFFDFAALF